MTDTQPAEAAQERFKRLIGVLIAVVTLITTVIAFVQSDAGARDDRANRDSKRYATEAFGRKVSGDARVNYAYSSAYQSWYELNVLADAAESRGEDAAAERYRTTRDEIAALSPLLSPEYFSADAGAPDVARYESDTYLVEITALQERFAAASAVKDAWDYKANTYIVHLTLLAVALFLFGLAATISARLPQLVFTVSGIGISVVTVAWAAMVYTQPVYDLRDQSGAIESYAAGVGLAHQDRYPEAIAAFDKALAAAPSYAAPMTARAEALAATGDLAGAVKSYESARAAGDDRAFVAGSLAWQYYLLGQLDQAVQMNQTALQAAPDELWIQFDLGLAQLAQGKTADAQATYAAGMRAAAARVAEAKGAGKEPPSDLWWSLDDAAASLDGLLLALDEDGGTPPRAQIADPAALTPAAEELIAQLKSLSVSLEYRGVPSEGASAATVSPLTFTTIDEEGNAAEAADVFPSGTGEVAALFDYAGLKDGQEVLFKVLINGEEDPSWRLVQPWDLGADGTAEKRLSPGYTDTFTFQPGLYEVEVYIDGTFAQRGAFTVEE